MNIFELIRAYIERKEDLKSFQYRFQSDWGAQIPAQEVARMMLFINHLHYVYIHNAYIMPEGFEGDALILDEPHPRASALEQSSCSIRLCHWSMGTRGC